MRADGAAGRAEGDGVAHKVAHHLADAVGEAGDDQPIAIAHGELELAPAELRRRLVGFRQPLYERRDINLGKGRPR